MKNVKFKSLVIQNFLSVGESPVSVDFNKGLNILTGRNLDKPDRQNAVGKSTVADALYFSIFGDTLREIKKDLITNNITGGKTQVELKFEVKTEKETLDCHVIRSLSPTKVFFYENGVDKTRDSTANTTKYICDVLSASPSVFQNCVIMTVNNAVPFMAKNKVEKRKFIEDIFGMEVFSKMLSLARQEYLEVKKDLDVYQTKLEENTKTHKLYTEQRDKINERKQEKKNLYLERQTNNEIELKNLRESIKDNHTDENLDEVKNIISELENKQVEVDASINELVNNISSRKTTLVHKKDIYKKIGTEEDKCQVCLRPLTDHDHEVIEQEKAELKNEMVRLAEEVNTFTEQLDKTKEKKEKIKKAIQAKTAYLNKINLSIQNTANVNTRIAQLEEWQEELVKDLDSLEHSGNEFDALLVSCQDRVIEIQEDISKVNKRISNLDAVKFIVSEEGVKSYIVNKLLDLLNNKLYYYLKKLDSNSVCVFNEFFEEEIVNEKGKICSYFNFSGAERKAIDLACLFAFSDIRRMQGGVSYNIAIYDELFDSSFDSKGIDLITEILQERVEQYGECSIVISHRKESLKSVTGEIIFLQKENGITSRVDYVDV